MLQIAINCMWIFNSCVTNISSFASDVTWVCFPTVYSFWRLVSSAKSSRYLSVILTENKVFWFCHRVMLLHKCCMIDKWLYGPAVSDFKRTVRTAQHVDQVIRHMPRGCWDRHPEVSREMINITLYIHVVRLFIKQPLLFRKAWYDNAPQRRKLYQVCNVSFYCKEQGSCSQYSHTGNVTTFL
jgi:hypothetical protein